MKFVQILSMTYNFNSVFYTLNLSWSSSVSKSLVSTAGLTTTIVCALVVLLGKLAGLALLCTDFAFRSGFRVLTGEEVADLPLCKCFG